MIIVIKVHKQYSTKTHQDEITECLTSIINQSITTDGYLDKLKIVNVFSVFKKKQYSTNKGQIKNNKKLLPVNQFYLLFKTYLGM